MLTYSVEHIHRVGIDTEVAAGVYHDAGSTAVGIAVLGWHQNHIHARSHHRCRTSHNLDTVNPPTVTFIIGCQLRSRDIDRPAAQNELDKQLTVLLLQGAGHNRIEVETLTLPHQITIRPFRIGVLVKRVKRLIVDTGCRTAIVILLYHHLGPIHIVDTLVIYRTHSDIRGSATHAINLHTADMVERQRDVTQRHVLREVNRVKHQLHLVFGLLLELKRLQSLRLIQCGNFGSSRRREGVVRLLTRLKVLMVHVIHLSTCRKTRNQKNGS